MATSALFAAGARLIARAPIVPVRRLRPDTTVVEVSADHVVLAVAEHTTAPGLAGILQGESGGASEVCWKLGPPLRPAGRRTVVRPILARDAGQLRLGPARWNGFVYEGDPTSALGLPFEEVEVQSPVGVMPAWQVLSPACLSSVSSPSTPGSAHDVPDCTGGQAAEDWVILVHGHGSRRQEALRALPLLHALGLQCLVVTYRNDREAAPSRDRLYHLGAKEWEDIEAACQYALDQGARRLVIVGWSMGGGIALRLAEKSAVRDRIAGLVLDGPAVDWQDILSYHAGAMHAPGPLQAAAMWMLTSPIGSRAVALREPIALAEMTRDYHADHLVHPTLLIHSLDDTYVPPGPSRDLAGRRPDLVRFVPFDGALHTREWNVDPVRWEREVAGFMTRVLGLSSEVEERALTRPAGPLGPLWFAHDVRPGPSA